MLCPNCNLAAEVVIDNFPKTCPVCGEVLTGGREVPIEELRASDARAKRILRRLQKGSHRPRVETQNSAQA